MMLPKSSTRVRFPSGVRGVVPNPCPKILKGVELVARGVQMEAWSVEDNGEGVCFHVYCYNVQPGVEIRYLDGESWRSGESAA